MPLKSLLFLGAFAACVVGALFNPLIGILGYVLHYSVGPERQWWAGAVSYMGIRYIYTIALATAIGIALNFRKLQYGSRLFAPHEKWILLFVGVVWLSVLISPPTVGRYTTLDHPSVKFTKVIVFVLMMTHIITTPKRLDALLWVLIIGVLVLGWQAYDTPYRQFVSGRLERVGGPDFAESNVLAAYLACMLPIAGVQFFRSGLPGKLLSLAAGVFATNAIILTRSRTAVLGLGAAGIAAMILAPRKHRAKIGIALAIAVLGTLYLSDPRFLERAGTISEPQEARDASAQSRLDIWEASIAMFKANPLGVGVGNFHQNIGNYNPAYKGRDSHNTFVRCYSELGIQGIAIFLAVIASAFFVLRRTVREAQDLPHEQREQATYICYGLALSLAAILSCGLTITLLYVEALWWILGLPVCLERVVANLKTDMATSPLQDRIAVPAQRKALPQRTLVGT